MLAKLTPAEFSERYCEYCINPWGEELKVWSAIGAAIVNEIRAVLCSFSSESRPEMLPADYFIPKPTEDQPQPSLDSSLATMRAIAMRGR